MATLKTIKRVKKSNKKDVTKGYVLWSGVSPVDNVTPIVAIATMKSKNKKTGNMVQIWIIRTDIAPYDAVKAAADAPICGNCKFKSGNGCYVRTEQAPLPVFKAFHRGRYPQLTLDQIPLIAVGREVRLGAYGDPAMVPFHIWEALIKNAAGYTGYTHQAEMHFFDTRISKICMVSTDTVVESELYNSMGYRTFTAIDPNEEIPEDQLVCPNFTHDIQCKDCLLCYGSSGNGKSIITIIHGTDQKIKKFKNNRGI